MLSNVQETGLVVIGWNKCRNYVILKKFQRFTEPIMVVGRQR